jgi:SAM-dependent methyltransferase
MRLNDPAAYRTIASEAELIRETLEVAGKRVLELGCGGAWMTRLLATDLGARAVVATEVDRVQHTKNLAIGDLPKVSFRFGGAEEIAAPDQDFDLVFMFKSLHHVPTDRVPKALREIHRVLRPDGLAYFSEPVYWGAFNDILRLFHDEKEVRRRAFEALEAAVGTGLFELVEERFFQTPAIYESWEVFEDRFLNVTHTHHQISPSLYAQIRDAFQARMSPDGAHFMKPHRVDILRRV